jgi:hypothetical protein
MAKNEIQAGKHSTKGKGTVKRSPKADAAKSKSSGSSSRSASPKGSTKGGGVGGFGKVAVGKKGCLPTVLTGLLITVAIIIF